MPHVIFELSDNILEKDLAKIMDEIHQILTDRLPAQLESCKSRVIRHQKFLVGNGHDNNAFIHLLVEVFPGRSKATLDLTASKIIAALQIYFKKSVDNLNLQISVTIKDLPEIYHKINITHPL